MKNVSSKGAETRIARIEISKTGLKMHSGRKGALHRAGKGGFHAPEGDTGRRAGLGRRERIGARRRVVPRAGPGDGAHVLYLRDRGCVNVAGCSTKKTMQSILEKA